MEKRGKIMRKQELKEIYMDLANIYLAKSKNDGRRAGLKLNLLVLNNQSNRALENNIKILVKWLKEE